MPILTTNNTETDYNQADLTQVPGIIVNHVPAATGRYIGSPSICILSDGTYLATHDEFGPDSGQRTGADTRVFRSTDRGESWKQIALIFPQFWSTIFEQNGAVYLIGTAYEYGELQIRKSTDGGHTWTTPTGEKTGLLDDGAFHCAPQPVVRHNGRIWRAMEDYQAPVEGKWAMRFRAFMMSAPLDSDLLDRANWTFSDRLARDTSWLDGLFKGWLEGNAVVTPEGEVVNLLRVVDDKIGDRAAVIAYDKQGKQSRWTPSNRAFGDAPDAAETVLQEGGFFPFPGANTKFLVRQDPRDADVYWALSNGAPAKHHTGVNLGKMRNTLTLMRSDDLINWEVRARLLYHPDNFFHGFQYPDWVFDGDDMAILVRTAYDDGLGGAHNYHDANFLTFHRLENFRETEMEEIVGDGVIGRNGVAAVETPTCRA